MRRILTASATAAALTVCAAATLPVALAGASGTRAKLALRQTKVGMILVNSRGFTLYAFSRDKRDTDACQRIRHCLTVWPPLTTSGKAIAGRGVKRSLIGAIRLRNGAHQVTYAGHPLYTYLGDVRPGQTSYVNLLQFHGYWPAVNAAGGEVK